EQLYLPLGDALKSAGNWSGKQRSDDLLEDFPVLHSVVIQDHRPAIGSVVIIRKGSITFHGPNLGPTMQGCPELRIDDHGATVLSGKVLLEGPASRGEGLLGRAPTVLLQLLDGILFGA